MALLLIRLLIKGYHGNIHKLILTLLLLLQTQVCVQQTCLDLLRLGMNVHILADGCSSRSQVDRLFAYEVSNNNYHVILT